MGFEFLLRLSAPYLHVIQAPREGLTDLIESLKDLHAEGLVLRRLRGAKMRREGALFDEVAAALQFPEHFGENWDAFDECLNDLDWLEDNAAALVISDADQVLAEADGETFGILLEVLQAERNAPLHVLFQAEGGHADALLGRMKAQGAAAVKLEP